ncbi:hypothetical protein Anapl_06385 [Anas platyrhynchos]|uniref:Uncharacterized protein n=1 Tax=Anas platyrhynchos TaxID=8839 RepID=R0LAH9_ANAPL|nr:hypothetical protein Anapl_06385 [Anas platyrhynchos]
MSSLRPFAVQSCLTLSAEEAQSGCVQTSQQHNVPCWLLEHSKNLEGSSDILKGKEQHEPIKHPLTHPPDISKASAQTCCQSGQRAHGHTDPGTGSVASRRLKGEFPWHRLCAMSGSAHASNGFVHAQNQVVSGQPSPCWHCISTASTFQVVLIIVSLLIALSKRNRSAASDNPRKHKAGEHTVEQELLLVSDFTWQHLAFLVFVHISGGGYPWQKDSFSLWGPGKAERWLSMALHGAYCHGKAHVDVCMDCFWDLLQDILEPEQQDSVQNVPAVLLLSAETSASNRHSVPKASPSQPPSPKLRDFDVQDQVHRFLCITDICLYTPKELKTTRIGAQSPAGPVQALGLAVGTGQASSPTMGLGWGWLQAGGLNQHNRAPSAPGPAVSRRTATTAEPDVSVGCAGCLMHEQSRAHDYFNWITWVLANTSSIIHLMDTFAPMPQNCLTRTLIVPSMQDHCEVAARCFRRAACNKPVTTVQPHECTRQFQHQQLCSRRSEGLTTVQQLPERSDAVSPFVSKDILFLELLRSTNTENHPGKLVPLELPGTLTAEVLSPNQDGKMRTIKQTQCKETPCAHVAGESAKDFVFKKSFTFAQEKLTARGT